MSDLAKIIGRGEDSKTPFKLRFDHIDSLAVEVSAIRARGNRFSKEELVDCPLT